VSVPAAARPIVDLDPMIGRDLPPLRVTALLGRGAMGRVYAAEHALLGRRVAIKVLEPSLARDPETVARFVDEARSVNSIRHPNIVDITDFGDVDGRPYFVMELLEGETVAERLRARGKMSPGDCIAIACQVASALAAAHDQGVVHRDLKPDNIFLCSHPDYPDRVKVLDFGVAKLVQRGDPGAPGRTEAGRVLGTPLYMSPEQCLGRPVDARSDIYALGVVMFECLTGAVPFDRESAMEVMMAHISDETPLLGSAGRPIPKLLEALVLRMMSKQPDARHDDMRQVRAAMLSIEEKVRRAVPPAPAATASTAVLIAPVIAPAIAPVIAPGPARGAPIADTLREIILHRIETKRLVLPAMPATVLQALAELRSPSANLARVAATLGRDPLIAPQVLRIASTAYYSTSRRPQNLLQAVVQLGVMRLGRVLVELSACKVFESPQPRVRATFEGIWNHSVAVASIARMVCNDLGNPVDADVVHLGGLLHDVGKPLVGVMLLEAEKVIGKNFRVDPDLWLDIVTQSHRKVAIELARSWELSEALCHVVASSDAFHDGQPTTNIVAFANALAKRHGRTVGPIDVDALDDQIALGAEHLELDWRVVHALPERLEREMGQREAE
jgi:putative nucleotidyltransferase with HDIG domain